jgi:predicted RNA binding protein YcfA (HicA-like mRNA interferase family)
VSRLPRRDGRWRSLFAALRREGWEVGPTNGGHLRATSPTGAKVFMASTPARPAYDRVLSMLRRHGFVGEGVG